eukprot:c18274_g1_i1 orf=767-2011(+)
MATLTAFSQLPATSCWQTSFASSSGKGRLKWDPLRNGLRCFHTHLFAFSITGDFRMQSYCSYPIAHFEQCLKVVSQKQELLVNQCTVDESLTQRFSKRTACLIREALKVLQKPAVLALLLGLFLLQTPDAWAASGGMVGGRAFSSGRSSGSFNSRTYSAPKSSFSFSAPYVAPSPFFGGGFGPSIYVGPAYGIGLGGGGGFFLLMLGFMAVFLVSGFLSDRSNSSLLSAAQKTSVLKIQVGLLGMARSLQRDLDRLADRANTSTPEGLHLVLTETVLSLLRHPDYWISGYSSSDIKRSVEAGEQCFNELSLEERGKFDEETLVNVDSFHRRSVRQRANSFNNEYIVVTLLVAAEGEYKLPIINSNADLREALRKLGSVPKDQTLAVEVLWTPQDANDTLSERELIRDYPLLRPL